MPNPFLRRPPQPIGTPIPQGQQDAMANQQQAMDPPWKKNLRTGFEGAIDTGLGALGVGPDTTANRAGAMIPAMAGVAGMAKVNPFSMGGSSGVSPNFAGPQAPNKMSAFTVNNISHLPQVPDMESYKQFMAQGMPHEEAIMAAAGRGPRAANMADNLNNVFASNRSVLDDAGRPIAPAQRRPDPAYAAHLASGRNKLKLPATRNPIPDVGPQPGGSINDYIGRTR